MEVKRAINMKKYNVLVPIYHEAGVDKKGNMQYNVSWKRIGKANAMKEAKKFTKHPVLEEVR